MANFLSDQLTNSAASPPVMNESTVASKVKYHAFSFTSSSVAQNDTVQLIKVPKGARIVDGRIGYTAWGAAVTVSLGDGTTAAKYLGATSIATAGVSDFANTIALKGLCSDVDLAAELTLTATIGGAAPAAGAQSLNGYVKYLLA